MLAILRKEFNSFFASPIGYLVIGVFLTLTGLLLWVFKGDFNIFDYGFADLSIFFSLAPLVLIFLIPAITMRSFADEKKQGTLELLLTRPLSIKNIILGKYLGALALVILALAPTLLYAYTLYELGNPVGNLDMGSTLGSYLGLLFLGSAYTAIGLFASTLSDNQIVAFLIGVLLCFLFYLGFDGLASILNDASIVANLGMKAHFESIAQGVLSIGDIVYFITLTLIFLLASGIKLANRSPQKLWWGILAVLLIGNQLAKDIPLRFDLTSDQRFTLSEAAIQTLDAADESLVVDVLLDGEIPSEFKKLQAETKQILEEYAAKTGKLEFNFVNPLEEGDATQIISELQQMGLKAAQATVTENSTVSQQVFFPWAIANYKEKSVRIPLLKNSLGDTQEERLSKSIQNLEYTFADGFTKLTTVEKKKVAVLRSHGTLEDAYIADFLNLLQDYYRIAPFDLKALEDNPKQTLENLERFDLFIAPKPTEIFTETEKQILDQFTMKGGKSLWLMDAVAIEMDSLYNPENRGIAVGRDWNLNDLFFKYGLRINPVLVQDISHAPIVLATGAGNDSQYTPVPWLYNPLVVQQAAHPITQNNGAVWLRFANAIDTLATNTKKTVLLSSSPLSKTLGTPRSVSLREIQQAPDRSSFNKPNIPLAVLLEGRFSSTFKNRVKPVDDLPTLEESEPTKMIVVADGDLIKNQLDNGGNPLELGFDKWTNNFYDNKEFLLNSVNYLLDDTGLMNIRSKKIEVAFLDLERVAAEKSRWQALNLGLPLILLGLFGVTFHYFRKRRYAG